MKIKSLFVMFAVLVLTAFSAAQDGAKSALEGSMVDAVGLPGQGWTSVGNLSPIEHNNFYTQSYFEQSAAVFSTYSGSITVTPFVGVGLVLDTKGYEWNNKILPRLGLKANKYFRKGVVSIGTAYSYEDRFKSIHQQRTDAFRPGLVWLAAGGGKIEPLPGIFLDGSRKSVAGRERQHPRPGLCLPRSRRQKVQPGHAGSLSSRPPSFVTARASIGTTRQPLAGE